MVPRGAAVRWFLEGGGAVDLGGGAAVVPEGWRRGGFGGAAARWFPGEGGVVVWRLGAACCEVGVGALGGWRWEAWVGVGGCGRGRRWAGIGEWFPKTKKFLLKLNRNLLREVPV